MTDEEAHTEAERRYANHGEVPLTAGAIRNARREAFERGAEWERNHPISDEAVRSAALAIHDVECSCPNAGGHANATIEHRNNLARAALEAARGTKR